MINVGGDEDYFGGASRSQLLSTSAEEVAAGGSVADLLVNKRRPTMLPSGIRRLIARASLASRGQSISPRLKEKISRLLSLAPHSVNRRRVKLTGIFATGSSD